jgi:cellulose synthase A
VLYLDWEVKCSHIFVGSPRVHGDEEEEYSDDIESEFASSTAGRSSVVHPYRVFVAESSMTSWDMDGISVTNSGASVNCYEEVMT